MAKHLAIPLVGIGFEPYNDQDTRVFLVSQRSHYRNDLAGIPALNGQSDVFDKSSDRTKTKTFDQRN